jgi:hypothetical protein
MEAGDTAERRRPARRRVTAQAGRCLYPLTVDLRVRFGKNLWNLFPLIKSGGPLEQERVDRQDVDATKRVQNE